jgi:hypothetical protein
LGTPACEANNHAWSLLVLRIPIVLVALVLAACATSPTTVPRPAEARTAAELFRSPTCDCCTGHGDYLTRLGFEIRSHELADVAVIKERFNVPQPLWSCHTTIIEGYVVEGHVPIEAIEHLLAERPAIDGIALPGMPPGSPGMGGEKTEPWAIFAFADGESWVYLEI